MTLEAVTVFYFVIPTARNNWYRFIRFVEVMYVITTQKNVHLC